jgi:hypothetical protein
MQFRREGSMPQLAVPGSPAGLSTHPVALGVLAQRADVRVKHLRLVLLVKAVQDLVKHADKAERKHLVPDGRDAQEVAGRAGPAEVKGSTGSGREERGRQRRTVNCPRPLPALSTPPSSYPPRCTGRRRCSG